MVFVILVVICEMVVYVATTPRPSDQFLQLYVLGSNQLAGNYYPNNDADIRVGEQVAWYLGVTNNMGTVQFVLIRVKISNETIPPPNDTLALDSPAPTMAEYARFMQDNETWQTSFVWSISNATSSANATKILNVQINNDTYQTLGCSASHGYNFRLIFELWTWQTNTDAFEFGWNVNGERHVAWLEVWFNATQAGPQPLPV